MEKKKHSRTQESFLIVFVAVCCVLVATTLWIAFHESSAGATTTDGPYSYPTYSFDGPTLTPHAHKRTPPPTIDPRTKQPTLTF